MLSFVQNWFTPKINPIGVDFGSDCLRLAQVHCTGSEYQLVAAASTDVPSHVRHNPAARLSFFVEAVRDMLAQGSFRSRHAVLALPASAMYIQHLRITKMDEAETKKILPWELRGKLPIDPSHALLRHLVAGEVYHDQEPKNEVIVMAAAREMINQLLAGAAKAKLNVIGMNVEPKAVIDCFSHIYRRKHDAEATTIYLDIGCGASRALIARGQQIFFVRSIPIGGDHFTKAVSQALKISFEEAKLLRIKLCAAQPAATNGDNAKQVAAAIASPPPTTSAPEPSIENDFPMLGAALQAQAKAQAPVAHTAVPAVGPKAIPDAKIPAQSASASAQAQQVELACREPLTRLIEELDLCRRYYEATFPNRPVDRMVFIGGEARHRTLCQHIARELGLAAQLGDPMSRMSRMSEIGIESGIDRRQPQPSWAVAVGLSLGPVESAVIETQAAAAGAA